jgi:hypothetical protein
LDLQHRAIWNDEKNYPQQKLQNPAGGGEIPAGNLLMVAEPYLTYNAIKRGDYAQDIFDLLLVTFTWNGKDGDQAGGTVTILDGMRWALKIAPVPEPSSILVAASSLMLIGAYLRVARRTPPRAGR